MTRFVCCLFCSFILLSGSSVSAGVVTGRLESVDSDEGRLWVAGWVRAVSPESSLSTMIVRLDNEVIYDAKVPWLPVRDGGHVDGEKLSDRAWRISTPLPFSFKMVRSQVSVSGFDEQGQRVVFRTAEGGLFESIRIGRRDRWRISDRGITQMMIAIVLSGVFCVGILGRHFFLSQRIRFGWQFVAAGLLAVFLLLVAFGITGSSTPLLIEKSKMSGGEVSSVKGSLRDVRSDEWKVSTAQAIAQASHEPPFPILNSNLGEDGQNMLVMSGLGLPVSHLSAISKPATWGFFIMDLSRALAWFWWFPVFGCVASLWLLFSVLTPGNWFKGFILSICFTYSAYCVAFSFSPAYCVFFPSLIVCLVVWMLRSSGWGAALGLSIPLGFLLAGFILYLYPPWLISLSTLYGLLAVGVMIRDQLWRRIDISKVIAFILATCIAVIILGCWYSSSREAIDAIMHTAYPGQRAFSSGGEVAADFFLRGFSNGITLYRLCPILQNQSEAASFYYFLLPLAYLFGRRVKQRRVDLVSWFVMAFVVWCIIYMLIGIPEALAKVILWNRVPSARVDLSLGLSSFLLYGLLLSDRKESSEEGVRGAPAEWGAIAVAVVWAVFVVFNTYRLFSSSPDPYPLSVYWVAGGVACLGGFLLASGRTILFLGYSLVLALTTTLLFHPVSKAPGRLVLSRDICSIIESMTDSIGRTPRILVAGCGINISNGAGCAETFCLAAGYPVVNSVLFYPQESLWNRLDPNEEFLNVYNRYQHLYFSLDADSSAPILKVESPFADIVEVTVSTSQFDFSLSGGDLLGVPRHFHEVLLLNPTLQWVSNDKSWCWFEILHK